MKLTKAQKIERKRLLDEAEERRSVLKRAESDRLDSSLDAACKALDALIAAGLIDPKVFKKKT